MGLFSRKHDQSAGQPIVVSMTTRTVGKSPLWAGIGIHCYDPAVSNTGTYLSRLGVNQVRMFFGLLTDMTLRDFVGVQAWGKDASGAIVASAAQFNSAVKELGVPNPQLARRFEESGFTKMAADLRQRGIDIILQLSGPSRWSFSTFDSNTSDFWTERWELVKYTDSLVKLSTGQGIKLFEVYNEPDILAKGSCDPKLINTMISRIQVVAVAVSLSQSEAQVIGPTLGRSQVPLNTGWLDPILQAQHDQLGVGQNPQWNNLQGFSYHRYAGGGDFFANLADTYQKEITTRLGYPLPLYVTEFNIHTAKDWDGRCDNPDTPERMTRFVAQAVAMLGKVHSLTAFCMAQYPNQNMQCGVNKNGMHLLDSSGQNITGTTLSAEAYRLFTKAFAGGQELDACKVGGPSQDVIVAASRSSARRCRYLFIVNNSGSPQSLDAHFGALGLTVPTPVHIESVGPGCRECTMQVGDSRTLTVSLEGHSVTLLTI